MIQAFVWKPDPNELDTINNLLQKSFSIENNDIIRIHDLSIRKIEVSDTDILLAFGRRSFNLASSSTQRKVHELPTPSKLVNCSANKHCRLETFQSLQKLAENKIEDQIVELTDKDLENLLFNQLITLQETLKKKKQEVWKGTTATGKTIALILKPDTKITDCEIVLTFEEVFAAKYAIEALGVDSLILTGR